MSYKFCLIKNGQPNNLIIGDSHRSNENMYSLHTYLQHFCTVHGAGVDWLFLVQSAKLIREYGPVPIYIFKLT